MILGVDGDTCYLAEIHALGEFEKIRRRVESNLRCGLSEGGCAKTQARKCP
jgi:hypothetical protein